MTTYIKTYSLNLLKGIAMGAANVIPGVSGGTIALITGIFERLINAIKSFNLKALKLLFKGKLKEFIDYTDIKFLLIVFLGVGIAIVSLARLFEYMFENYPVYIWGYFFGLVLASVFFVGKKISKWSWSVIIVFITGAGIAVILSILNPSRQNDSFIYLIICGAVAMCSMILPGLSGSFVLFLMGNYKLVAIDAINNMNFKIILPVLLGAGVGLIVFSHLLSWIFKKFRDQTIGILTGFILGSVSILWPWQKPELLTDNSGNIILKKGEEVITGYQRYIPSDFNTEVIIAIAIVLAGISSIWIIEKVSTKTGAHTEQVTGN